MKRFITIAGAVVTLFSSALFLQACGSKDKPEPPAEQNLVVVLSPDPGTTIAHALGTTYDFQVKVESIMPQQGVDISVAYKKDSDQSVVFSRTYMTSFSPLNVTITSIPFNEVGTVTVTVTSKAKASNTVTKTFKLVKK